MILFKFDPTITHKKCVSSFRDFKLHQELIYGAINSLNMDNLKAISEFSEAFGPELLLISDPVVSTRAAKVIIYVRSSCRNEKE